MAVPATPTKAKPALRPATGSRLTTADPTKPLTRSADRSAMKFLSPHVGDTSDPFAASTSAAAAASPSTTRVAAMTPASIVKPASPNPAGWTLGDGVVKIVSSSSHENRLVRVCSWLHMFEHARYLHAGLPQGAVRWPDYPSRTADSPFLRDIHAYLSSLLPGISIKQPDSSLETTFPAVESKEELQAAFKLGTIHFSGELSSPKTGGSFQDRRLVFKLCPPSAGMGSALYRKYGSDRFLRIKLDDETARLAAPLFDRSSTDSSKQKSPPIREQLQTFLHHPLLIFGRTYRPFCTKDGAIFYFCERGVGIDPREERTLAQFAQEYLDVQLNPSMSVAKYCARFELGLTTTTPTVTFPRHRVLRTPDLMSDSLKISVAMMQHVRDTFYKIFPKEALDCLPGSYLPSCIRGTIRPTDKSPETQMVWQLDYSTSRTSDKFIHAHRFSSVPHAPTRPYFTFTLQLKDGTKRTVPLQTTDVRWEPAWSGGESVVMTDGCSLMSFSAMEILAEKHSATRSDMELKPSIPAVAQGRLGPGKGVWAVAPETTWNKGDDPEERWIEVRDSQWKFEDKQTSEFTFELHSVPGSGKGSAKIGKQMFEVLAHCGVPPSAFKELLRRQTAFWSPPSMPALLYHIEKTCGVMEDRTLKSRLATDPGNLKLNAFDSAKLDDDEGQVVTTSEGGEFVHDGRLDPYSAAPNVVSEVVVEMLQSGFEPRENPHLASKLKMVARMSLEKQLSFRVDDDSARTAFVIADHLGVLEEGEFFFQVRGVFRPEYKTFWDVIIVSAKGERSLCSILSGGDYDGDKLLCMTNPAIVSAFDPSRADPQFADPPFADSDWFQVDRRKVKDHVAPLVDPRTADNSALAKVFLESLFLGTQYGALSTYHTTLAYTRGLDHPLTSEAGHLFCRALDGRKQGLSFTPEKWALAKKRFYEGHKEKPRWTWIDDGKKPPEDGQFAKRPTALGEHPMDELAKERDAILRQAGKRWEEWCEGLLVKVDEDLASEWRRAWEFGLQQRTAGRSAYFNDLTKILNHVRLVYDEYKNTFIRWQRERETRQKEDDLSMVPGSPTKASPSKQKGWRASSRGQKDELLALSKKFWSVVEPGRSIFESEKLQGEDGAKLARTLIASCAYIDPLRPTPAPVAVGEKAFLDRLLDCGPRSTSAAASPSKPVLTESSATSVNPSGEITITSTRMPMADDDPYGDDDFPYSQVSLSQAVQTFFGSNSSSQTVSTTVVASTTSSSQPSAPTASPLVAPFLAPAPSGLRTSSFRDAATKSEMRFCFDMGHRDVLSLKANAITRRLHGEASGARGITAPCVAPHMLDVLSVSKRCAGITSARTKVRPRSLLPPEEPPLSRSPAKKQRTM
ncbi:hypothetical protein JCM1840_003445 [Sporobolomyces johnsonii]